VILASLFTFAQQKTTKNDVVLKQNGDELVGKVIKISESDIDFSYAGESLTYTIKKSDVIKITFASGRTEVFSRPAQVAPAETKVQQVSDVQPAEVQSSKAPASTENHHNRVAILPFAVVMDGQLTASEVSEHVQNDCYSVMSKHAGVYTVLNPRTTNALLIKAGVTAENIKGYTMEDLCNILGVEYVVDCMVSVNKTSESVSQSNSGEVKNKNKNSSDQKFNTYSYGTATQNYKTNLALSMYDDKGNSIYSQNRNSFWSTQDAYRSTLEYLLKRSPLYTKN
jgi:hypothetical protein